MATVSCHKERYRYISIVQQQKVKFLNLLKFLSKLIGSIQFTCILEQFWNSSEILYLVIGLPQTPSNCITWLPITTLINNFDAIPKTPQAIYIRVNATHFVIPDVAATVCYPHRVHPYFSMRKDIATRGNYLPRCYLFSQCALYVCSYRYAKHLRSSEQTLLNTRSRAFDYNVLS